MTWHVNPQDDAEARKIVIGQIVAFLDRCRTSRSEADDNKIIELSRRMEVYLYKSSKSKEEYMDTDTLSYRVRELKRSSHEQQQQQTPTTTTTTLPTPNANGTAAAPTKSHPPGAAGANSKESSGQQNQTSQPSQQEVSIRPIQTGNNGVASQAESVPSATTPTSNQDLKAGAASQQQQQPSSRNGTQPTSNSNGGAAAAPTEEQQRQYIIKQRQQRLLLLRHASKCVAKEGECTVTPHCADMKRLWLHIAKCKDQQCAEPHCVSSRCVLSHYHRCKDPACEVCRPVRQLSQQQRQKRQQQLMQQQAQQQGGGAHALVAAASSGRSLHVSASGPTSIRVSTSASGLPTLRLNPAHLLEQAAASHYDPETRASHEKNLLTLRKTSAVSAIDPNFARGSIDGSGPSLPLSMTPDAIASHVASLRIERMQSFLPFIRKLMEHKCNRGIFNEPVDIVALPDYKVKIKEPMDLGTIRRRLEDGKYRAPDELIRDIRLVFQNAMDFNPRGHGIYDMAAQILRTLDNDFKKHSSSHYSKDKKEREKCQLCNEEQCEICPLCERGCVAFEPKMIYCAGPCNGRVARNAYFFTVPGTTFQWCQECHDRSREPYFEIDGIRYEIKDMVKKKNSELFGEPWVSCDKCERWVHQVCALFNPRNDIPNDPKPYTCPQCLIRDANEAKAKYEATHGKSSVSSSTPAPAAARGGNASTTAAPAAPPASDAKRPRSARPTRRSAAASASETPEAMELSLPTESQTQDGSSSTSTTPPPPPPPGAPPTTSQDGMVTTALLPWQQPKEPRVPYAEELPHTRLGLFLERWVREKLGKAREEEAKNPPLISGDLGPGPDAIRIRVVSTVNQKASVKPHTKQAQGFPDEFPYTTNCIYLFQTLDGVDVLLFVMYVQEYGSDCPEPNRRKLYIAYLDSVHFFRPRHHRTLVYHELLLAYMEYSRRNGQVAAYIWACPPPNKRDDYILHCHPEDQRVPSPDRLRKWYHDMIRRGALDGIVLSSCALYEEHYEASAKQITKHARAVANRKLKAAKKSGKSKSKSASKKGAALIVQKGASKGAGDAMETDGAGGMDGVRSDSAAGNEEDIEQEDDGGLDTSVLDDVPDMQNEDEDAEDVDEEGGANMASAVGGNGSGSADGGEAAGLDSNAANGGNGSRSASALDGNTSEISKCLEPGRGLRAGGDRMLPEDVERRKNAKLASKGLMPYFDGDYWPQEAEDLAKDAIKKEKAKLGEAKLSKTDGGRKRRRGVVEESNAVGTTLAPNANGETGEGQEVVVADMKNIFTRIGNMLDAMRDDFLVVKLAHECTRCGTYLLRGRWECRHPTCMATRGFSQSPPFALCNACYRREKARPLALQHGGGCIQVGAAGEPLSDSVIESMEKGEDQKVIDETHKPEVVTVAPAAASKPQAENAEATQPPKTTEEPNSDASGAATPAGVTTELPTTAAPETTEAAPKAAAEPQANAAPAAAAPEKPTKPADIRNAEMERRKKETEHVKTKFEEWNAVPIGSLRPGLASLVEAPGSSPSPDAQIEEGNSTAAAATTGAAAAPTPSTAVVVSNIQNPTGPGHELYYVDEGLPIVTPKYDWYRQNAMLDSRHAFLSLCTTNRYQFDQLRRAKYSTMMLLYHIHNPHAPAHLFTCNECQKDIITGFRYHCELCKDSDFDLCHQCVERTNHHHVLIAYQVTGGVDVDSSEAQRRKNTVEDKRRSRMRSLELFLRALVHASKCQDANCREQACPKMKDLLRHRHTCTIRVRGGCEVCRRVLCLVQMHARDCREANCVDIVCNKQCGKCHVPHCGDLKLHMRQQIAQARQAAAMNATRMNPTGSTGNGTNADLKLKIRLPTANGGGVASSVVSQAQASSSLQISSTPNNPSTSHSQQQDENGPAPKRSRKRKEL